MGMVESGQLEEMLVEILQSPEVEQMVDELMAEIMRPPTEEEQALMQVVKYGSGQSIGNQQHGAGLD